MSANYLIIGAGGQLGRELKKRYPDATAVDQDKVNIGSLKSLEEFDWAPYKVIINAAAWTNVDAAELSENRANVWSVNASGPAYLSRKARELDATLIHISTDYVFDGRQELHKEDETFSPLSVYGASKAAADLAVSTHAKHFIIRTSWVIGAGNNFVQTMASLARQDVSPSVVHDQIGRLTFTTELVRGIDHLLTNQCEYGVYNLTNSGEPVSWLVVAQEVFSALGRSETDVRGVSTEEYFQGKTLVAPRPLLSTLDLSKIQSTKFVSHDWREELQEYMKREVSV